LNKPYGVNLRCYWEPLGELGELHGNKGKTKNPFPPHFAPPPSQLNLSLMHVKPFHYLHEIFISKIICHHFWLELMLRAQTMGHNGVDYTTHCMNFVTQNLSFLNLMNKIETIFAFMNN